MPDVTMIKCDSYDVDIAREALKRAIEPFGLDWVREGETIAIKANLVTAMKPEAGATTHPVLVTELARMLIERGAKVIVGDSPGGPFTPIYVNRVYSATGMSMVESVGGALNHDYSERALKFPEAKVMRDFTCTAYLDDADDVISFCKIKTHGMMAMSASVKNLFGAIPGTMKPEYHFRYPNHDDFTDMLIDLNMYFKPKLSLCDAIVGMEGNGPTMGHARKIGVLMASDSPYKLDLAAAHTIGLTREDVPTIEASYKRGLCPAEFSELDIAGDGAEVVVSDFDNFKFKRNIMFRGTSDGFMRKLMASVASACLTSKPNVVKSECVGCGKCAGICPAKAITMTDGKPVIDRSKCIRCFCCQEFCPKGAMKVKRPLIARFLDRGAKN